MTPRLLLLTDRSQLPLGRSLRATVTAAVTAGAADVLLRELDLRPAVRAALSADLTASGARVIAARGPLPGCVGVHLAAHQPVTAAGGLPFGRSCHTVTAVAAAAAEGARWVTLSPFAASASKPGRGPALAPDALAGPHPVPVLALGGIDADNALDAVRAGADGVAVMGAVMRAADPASTVARLHDALAATRAGGEGRR
ncbi:thiamine phosphate synthase [Nocardioides sambongensis]|uniref:thiamine phosphate synthase n=1 Tax=Nocardioides sambongensis TaxID=2589074 RepID=UPI00112A56BA|nr:thiamine phosphate synthase [Nocardioides sambongensis]